MIIDFIQKKREFENRKKIEAMDRTQYAVLGPLAEAQVERTADRIMREAAYDRSWAGLFPTGDNDEIYD